MKASRRAESEGASNPLAGLFRTAALVIGIATATVAAGAVLVAIQMARRVVIPKKRPLDTRIVDLDLASQTISLARTPDTVLPGRYGLFTSGSESYLQMGGVLAETDSVVKRKLLTHVSADAQIGSHGAFSGWYYTHPEQLHLPFSAELIPSAVGPCPAWLFPGEPDTDLWVIQVHGWGTTRAECLRAVPVFHELGINTLIASYRNDGEAPRSRTGTYGLGATEWRDIDAALSFVRARGGRRVILMGWSMGGAIVLQVELNSAHRDLIAGLILESPVVNWQSVLRFQGTSRHLPGPVTQMAYTALESDWAASATGTGEPIPFEKLDVVARADELRDPILILHSDDDGFVPSDGSHRLVAARPDLVELQSFTVARHTKLWNYDQTRWTKAITRWLQAHSLVPAEESS